MAQATATYTAQTWKRKAWHSHSEDVTGNKLFHIEMFYTYEGDIQAEGMVHYLVSQKGEREINFVALEKVVGSIAGRFGSFVLQRVGVFGDNRTRETITVLPGSGTDELNSLSGHALIEHIEHREVYSIVLDYTL